MDGAGKAEGAEAMPSRAFIDDFVAVTAGRQTRIINGASDVKYFSLTWLAKLLLRKPCTLFFLTFKGGIHMS